jgi:hypothetical protein
MYLVTAENPRPCQKCHIHVDFTLQFSRLWQARRTHLRRHRGKLKNVFVYHNIILGLGGPLRSYCGNLTHWCPNYEAYNERFREAEFCVLSSPTLTWLVVELQRLV